MTNEQRPLVKSILSEVEEQMLYCEKLIASETRLQLAALMLEEIQEKLHHVSTDDAVEATYLRSVAERLKLLYHRAKALLALQEEGQSKNIHKPSNL